MIYSSFESPFQRKAERILSPQEREIKDYIESHKTPVERALERLIKEGARFILVGELHLIECEPVRRKIATSLQRLKEAGLTHVALELDSEKQSIIDELDFSNPHIKKY
jgi:hypothetical protein